MILRSDRYAWANSADPDQTAPRGNSSNFRVITTNFLGVRIFRKFTVTVGIYCEFGKLIDAPLQAKILDFLKQLKFLEVKQLNW